MADTDLLKFIANGSQVGTQPADIMGGVIVAMDVLGTQFPKGSVVRKMYVLTDLAEELDMDATEAVAERAKALEISLNVVIFDALQQPSVRSIFPDCVTLYDTHSSSITAHKCSRDD